MSALARFLLLSGYSVSGSDRTRSSMTDLLSELGAKVFIGHSAENAADADIIVYNSAIDSQNVELAEANRLGKTIIKRVELLSKLMREFNMTVGFCGCHGKTTSTSMFSHVLRAADSGFTCHIGGYDNDFGNLFVSGKDVFATEVCEFQKNIDYITSDIAVALNIDNDHMNSFSSFEDLKSSFYDYLDRSSTPIINADDRHLKFYGKRAVTFAVNESADYTANVSSSQSGMTFKIYEHGKKLFEIKSKTLFAHDAYNMLAATAAARVLKIDERKIYLGLRSFKGIKRRNEFLGTLGGAQVFADYAHHPRELESSLKNYKLKSNNIIVVFQPHTFSRTKLLFNDFVDVLKQVDDLKLFKTYPARETPDMGTDAKTLSEAISGSKYYENINELTTDLKDEATKKNLIVILGAGDLYDLIKPFVKN